MASNTDTTLRDDEEKTKEALRELFDLLESFAPPWYTKEHRDKTQAALSWAGRQPERKRKARYAVHQPCQ